MSVLNTKQLVIMIVFIPLVFKMATLPSLIYSIAETSSYITILIVAIIEFLQLFFILIFVNKGGMEKIKERYGENIIRILGIPLLLVFFAKFFLSLSETFTYLQYYAFYNVRPEPIIISFLLIAGYLAFKGAKTIGRLFELAIWFLPIILIVGLGFGEINVKMEYAKMVFDKGVVPVFLGVKKYIIYTCDFTPLLFIKLDNKKNSTLKYSLASVFSILLLGTFYMLVIVNSCRATFLINEAFADLASFNTVTSEVGNLEWPSGLLWVSISLFSLSLMIFAIAEIAKSYKIKRQFSIVFSCTAISIVSLLVFTKTQTVLRLLTQSRQYVIFGIEMIIPIILLLLILIKSRRKPSEES